MFEPVLTLYLETFFILLFAHFLVDFPLQGDYLSKTKDPTKNLAEFWFIAMFGHCMIHAGVVFIITGSLILGVFQLVTHFITDYAKCKQWFGEHQGRAFAIDQAIHIAIVGITTDLYVRSVTLAS